MDLQQDEIELANSEFKTLFYLLLEQFQTRGELQLEKLMPSLSPALSTLVSSILMDDEKYELHQWEKKNIFVKTRDQQIGLMVNETILSLRKFLVNKKIEALQGALEGGKKDDQQHLLEDAQRYIRLRKLVSTKLNRVL